jgi:ParB family transcriptional regulator, chromosome partitioning protein
MKPAAVQPQIVVEQIPVSQIQPSTTNPRKHYDQAALEELAASIKSVGVQAPLLLRMPTGYRKIPFNYEIVGGERRWRAAQIAGLAAVPAIVREMNDAECREAQLIDNLQRADLSPMEEAEAYEALHAAELPVEVLAAKVGKTVQYVTQRLRLLQLIPDAREALRQGALNLTLALLIARLAPVTQEKATLYAIDPQKRGKGKTLAERIKDVAERTDADMPWDRVHCATESDMRDWIADNTLLPLKGVAWRLDDIDLIPGAGPCTECPKRSGNAVMLFGDLAADGDTCTDPECYDRKRKATVKEALKREANAIRLLDAESFAPVKEGATSLKRGQWMEAKVGSCPQVTVGVTEDGRRIEICPDQKCKLHKHRVERPIERGQSAADWEAERKKTEEAKKAYVEAERPIRLAVYAEIRKKLTSAKLLRLAVSVLAERGFEGLAALRGIEVGEQYLAGKKKLSAAFMKAKDAELEGWLADALAGPHVLPHDYLHDERKRDREGLWNIGELVGVDCDAIAKKVTGPVAKSKAAKKAVPAPAKKKDERKVANGRAGAMVRKLTKKAVRK